MEDLLSDYVLQLKELKSCIVMLKHALENEGDTPDISDIDNYAEVMLEKVDALRKNFDIIVDQYHQN